MQIVHARFKLSFRLSFAISFFWGLVALRIMEVQSRYNGSTKNKRLRMAIEKRKKTKMLQFRVTPKDFDIYEEYAKEKGISKTELFSLFLKMLKDKKI